ncbi:DUF350 domain-containing protein [Fulvivirgaceae bacterium BMA10]|uniref:DUF350 domain-containing protein n=1 Tax=Splendidivirga corallicola TaxID=3051826 RepID=A0ABT8KHD8_9BACT|nr:DUF350 domain-containing protein [Fulvivirgaceae bacterium BMA10]
MEIVDGLLTTLVYLASSFVLFFIGKLIYQLLHKKIKVQEELVEKDNFAFALSHTGYFVGLLISIGSVMLGESEGLMYDMINIGIYGGMAVILLNLSVLVNDKIILRKFSIRKEVIEDRNAGVGIVEGAISIATGLIIMGSIYGEGGILSAIVYWVIGQAILIITSYVYNWITPYDIHIHIERDNVAVGIGFAGALIAIANLIRFALMHDFEDWLITIENVSFDVVIGLLFLPLARLLTDKILLPGRNLTDEIINQEHPNLGAAVIEAFAYIGGSVLITWSL